MSRFTEAPPTHRNRARQYRQIWLFSLILSVLTTHVLANDSSAAHDGLLGGKVWLDVDADGLQHSDSSIETGIDKAYVQLIDENAQVIAFTYTDNTGFYLFDNLSLGKYQVLFGLPSGCQFTTQDVDGNANDLLDSDASPSTGHSHVAELNVQPIDEFGGLGFSLDGSTDSEANNQQPMNFSIDAGVVCTSTPTTTTQARDDETTAVIGESVIIDVLANDTLSDQVTSVMLIASNFQGTAQLTQNQLVISNMTVPGTYTLSYRVICADGTVSEGIVTVTVTAQRPPSVSIEANNDYVTALIGDSLTVDFLGNDGEINQLSEVRILDTDIPCDIRFTSDATPRLQLDNINATGSYSLTYEIIGANGSRDIAEMTLLVDNPIVANDDIAQGDAGQALTVDILANDTPQDSIQQVTIVDQGLLTDVSLSGSGQNTQLLVGNSNSAGNYSLVYGLTADNGSYSTAQVNISISSPPPPPPPRSPMACETQTGGGIIAGVEIHEKQESDFANQYGLFDVNGQLMLYTYLSNTSEYEWSNSRSEWEVEWEGDAFNFIEQNVYYVAAIENGVRSTLVYCNRRSVSPIALDINHSGNVERIKGHFEFDFAGNGQLESVSEWFAPSEGILISTHAEHFPLDGTVTGQHLFGDMNGKFRDGYAKLTTLDINSDGQIRGVELSHLGIWRDINSNAKLDAGELSSLASHSIVSLSTTHVNYLSRATLINGKTLLMEDVWFPVLPVAMNSPTVTSPLKYTALIMKKPYLLWMLGSLIVILGGLIRMDILFARHLNKSQHKLSAAH